MAPTKTLTANRSASKPRTPADGSGAWSNRHIRGLQILQVPAFAKIPWLVHGFSTRPGGLSDLAGEKVLNLGFTDWDTRETVMKNRRHFQSAVGADGYALATLKQFHSDVVHPLDDTRASPFHGLPAQAGDASVTNRPGLLLAVQTADCVPILLVDPKRRAIAAIHAGWRGTLRRIVVKTVGKMQMHFATRPADLHAAIGPSIGGCCYEVGTEVAVNFKSQFSDAADWFDELRTGDEPNPLQWLNMAPPGHQPPSKNVFLDLKKANLAQLLEAGLRPQNTAASSLCTACCRDLLFSYRKEGARTGRLMAVIGIRPA